MERTHCNRRIQGHHRRRPLKKIGVFDSGVGGLSILKALRAELPHEDFVYVADSGYAPYGERDDGHVIARSRLITDYLREQHDIKALVIACNTATAAAIHLLRQQHPDLPIIGVEPALKPAVSKSKTHRIGVMATRGTLASAKFRTLVESLTGQADFVCQPCDGLADAIEHQDATKTIALCANYTGAMGQFGTKDGEIDSLVLGCTHYPFASQTLSELVGAEVRLIDNGEPVARQTRRRLATLSSRETPGHAVMLTTGEHQILQNAAQHWLGLDGPVQSLLI